MTKKCIFCGNIFITDSGKRECCYNCIPKNLDRNERLVTKRRLAKHYVVQRLGGQCEKCGEKREHILALHHIDPANKMGTPAQLLARSVKDFLQESQKCILLCHNCHADFHFLNTNMGLTLEQYLEKEIPTYKNDSTCETQILINENIDIPSKEELQKILFDNKGNFTQTGKYFKVTDNTIRKWCKDYDLPYHCGDYDSRKGEAGAKAIIMLDKDSQEELQRFDSIAEAARFLNVTGAGHIGKAANGKVKTAYGYKWRFVN